MVLSITSPTVGPAARSRHYISQMGYRSGGFRPPPKKKTKLACMACRTAFAALHDLEPCVAD